MRPVLVVLSVMLLGWWPSVARAQAPEAPPAVDAAPTRGPRLADRAATPVRFSRFSAGPGGPLQAFSQLVNGLLLGALVGGELTPGRADGGQVLLASLAGGLLLGGAHTVVQAFHPVSLTTAGTIALGSAVGALAGFGVATLGFSSFLVSALVGAAFSQVGALVPLLALSNADISGADLELLGMTSVLAFVLTGLSLVVFDEALSRVASQVALLVAPAVGMALGSLWALGPDLAKGRAFKLTVFPLVVGLATFIVGAAATQGNLRPVGAAAFLAVATTFGITYFATADAPGRPSSDEAPATVTPSVTLTPAGWRNEGLAVGPALAGRF